MYKAFVLLIWLTIIIGTGACSKDGGGPNSKLTEMGGSPHNAGGNHSPDFNLVEIIKGKTFAEKKSVTIGDAFDGYKYFVKKEWKQSPASNGKTYIDFIGWFDTKSFDIKDVQDGTSARGIDVKFAVYKDGSYGVVMVSRLEARSDGKLYENILDNRDAILTRIYENREIGF